MAKNDLSTIAGCKRILSDAGAQLPAAGDTYDDLLLLAAATVKRQRQTGGRLTNTKVSTEDKVVSAITVAELIRLSSAIEAGTEANKTPVDVKGTLTYVPGKLLVKRCGRGGGKLFGCSWQTSNDVCGKCQAAATNEAFHEWLFEFTLQDWDNETVSADVLAVVKGGNALFGMNANEFYQLTPVQQSDLLTSLMFKPYVMTLGVGIVKGKFSRCAWDVQSVPGSSTSFKASLGL